jgi:hypothetical protein
VGGGKQGGPVWVGFCVGGGGGRAGRCGPFNEAHTAAAAVRVAACC